MTYAESIEFLYSLRLFGLKLGLENTFKLAALTGNPQDQLQFIHIAGTNGKGSVAAMLESVYRKAGLRVGLYTSPHLVSFRERIQVDREWIGESDVVRRVEGLRALSRSGFTGNRQPETGSPNLQDACPTFFEFVTVMALQHFAEKKCDLVIWETGMGGRLDATNIVTPWVSVITNVEQDHQRWLGHDLKRIAAEKAGIVKPGVPVVTAAAEPGALAVIEQTALAGECPLTIVTPAHVTHPPLDRVQLPLLGWHQRMNAATALAVVRALQSRLPVDEETIRHGLENVHWPGRLQLLERRRCGTDLRSVSDSRNLPAESTGHRPVPQDTGHILLDGAHNAAGATSLRAVLEEDFAHLRPALILGILQDKDWNLMCEVLAPVAERIICVPVKSDRSTDPHQLAKACQAANRHAHVTVARSMGDALREFDSAPFVVVAGSLYLAGEALDLLKPEDRLQTDEQRLNEWSGAPRG